MEGQGEVARMGENYESSVGRRSRDEEHESRSGSDNMDGASCDDQDADDKPPRKKRYHRHTPQQIQELEAYSSFLCSRENLIYCFFLYCNNHQKRV